MFISSNIRFLRNRQKLTQATLALGTGLSRSQLAGYETSVTPPIDALVKLADFFKVTLDALVKIDLSTLNELGIRELNEQAQQRIAGSRLRVLATTVNEVQREWVEVVPLKAKAGYLTGYEQAAFVAELPRLHLPFVNSNRKHRVFQLDGDSMLPLQHGSWVVCEYIEDWLTVKQGERCVVLSQTDGLVFKRVYNKLATEGTLLLVSDNARYEPYTLLADDVLEIWRYRLVISSQ